METYESVKSNPVQPEQKEKKKGGAWKGIVAVILAAGVRRVLFRVQKVPILPMWMEMK